MAEVTIFMNGRSYDVACDDGQEGRVTDLAAYIDQKLQQISRSGAAYNDAHLMVLTSLVLADELFDTRATMQQTKATTRAVGAPVPPPAANKDDETAVLRLLEQITKRIDGIATRVQSA